MVYENYLRIHFADRMKIIRSSIMREEVGYQVLKLANKSSVYTYLINLFTGSNSSNGVTIIYSRYISRCVAVYSRICAAIGRENVALFHGQLSTVDKDNILRGIFDGNFRVIVATLAFGMGIDLPNVCKVIAVSKFDSLIDIVQIAGRAGRHRGRKSLFTLVFSPDMIKEDETRETNNRRGHCLNAFIDEERNLLKKWMFDCKYCRLAMISIYLHGKATNCPLAKTMDCDRCEPLSAQIIG